MTDNSRANAMWGGRFASGPDAIMEEINASIDFDRKLYAQDIRGSLAHVAMLAKTGIIAAADADTISRGLNTILSEIEAGSFTFSRRLEDIHMNVEARLAEIVGPVAGRLHTARSRNDQVAVDFRLWVKEELEKTAGALKALIEALLARAEEYAAAVMPGFTHLQTAQPVTFGHHLMAYVEMFGRDLGRTRDCIARLDECPLGAAALAGTGFPIDRHATARALGFREPTRNSIDFVSDRDFALEFLGLAAICATHLSRFAEELVIWSTPQFAFVRLSDAFSTGSSIMPQKKNPDAAELVRAKTGRVNGALVALLTVMKGLPLAYSKDMQEDKEAVFDAAETLELCLAAMTGMVRDLSADTASMKKAAGVGLFHRDRSRRLARARMRPALPRSPSRHRPRRGSRRGAQMPSRKAFARRTPGDPSGHHRRCLRHSFGGELGEEPQKLRRHGARRGAPPDPLLEETAREGLIAARTACCRRKVPSILPGHALEHEPNGFRAFFGPQVERQEKHPCRAARLGALSPGDRAYGGACRLRPARRAGAAGHDRRRRQNGTNDNAQESLTDTIPDRHFILDPLIQ